MAFEVVPTAAGRLHSDQYTKIIIINTPINLRVFPCFYRYYSCIYRYSRRYSESGPVRIRAFQHALFP